MFVLDNQQKYTTLSLRAMAAKNSQHSPCLSDLSPLKLLPLFQDQVEGHRYAIIKEIQADLQKVLNMLTRKIFKNQSWQKCWD